MVEYYRVVSRMKWHGIESGRNREGIQKRRRHISKKKNGEKMKSEEPTYPTREETGKVHD